MADANQRKKKRILKVSSSFCSKSKKKKKLSKEFSETIWELNFDLHEKYGPALGLQNPNSISRSLIVDDVFTVSDFDNLVDRIVQPELRVGSGTKFDKDRASLILCTLGGKIFRAGDAILFVVLLDEPSPALVSAAMIAGLFPFGVPVRVPPFWHNLGQQGILAFELAGLGQHKGNEGDHGGRVILEGIHNLLVGKRCLKSVSSEPFINTVDIRGGPCVSTASAVCHKYWVSISTDPSVVDTVWSHLVLHHGVDWMGFDRVRRCFTCLSQTERSPVQLVAVQLVYALAITCDCYLLKACD
jgi:hypothetical protein